MHTAIGRTQSCKLAVALEVDGERWSLLIVNGAANGLQHFEEYQESLGIARNILSNRLTKLVKAGVMIKIQQNHDRRKFKYKLTNKDNDLLTIISKLQ